MQRMDRRLIYDLNRGIRFKFRLGLGDHLSEHYINPCALNEYSALLEDHRSSLVQTLISNIHYDVRKYNKSFWYRRNSASPRLKRSQRVRATDCSLLLFGRGKTG